MELTFLLSMPRAGSTLLSLMLGSHPEICCPPEPWIVLAVAEYLDLGKVRNEPYDRAYAEIAAIEFLLNPERKQRGALGSALRGIGKTSRLGTITAPRKILHAAYQLHLDVSGKSIFVDKTPRYYTVLGLIDDIFPRAKKIVLLRNPMDIFASYKTTWEIQRSIFTSKGVTVHTRDFCEGLFTLADYLVTSKDDVLVLHYEDLARDPESALQSVCAFEGIDFSPMMLTYYKNTALIEDYRRSPVGDPIISGQSKPTHNRSVNAWEKRLDADDVQALIGVLGISIFKRLGYGDMVTKLRGMSVNIPTEEQALKRRNLLIRSLVKNVHEQPFSTWGNFVLPLKECQADREARLKVIEVQGRQLGLIPQLKAEKKQLFNQLRISETDRAARMEVIEAQGKLQCAIEAERNDARAELNDLRQQFESVELDRAARMEVIEAQGRQLGQIPQFKAEKKQLINQLQISEADRAARMEVIEAQGKLQGAIEAERNDARAELNDLRQQLESVELDRTARMEVIEAQGRQLGLIPQLKADKAYLINQLQVSEADRVAQSDVISEQKDQIDSLQSQLHNLQSQWLVKALKRIKLISDRASLSKTLPRQGDPSAPPVKKGTFLKDEGQ